MAGEVLGAKRLLKKLEAMSQTVQKEVAKAVQLSALDIQKDAVKSIQQGGRSGKEYKRGKKIHIASAPGEPPKTDTGALVRNITVEKVGEMVATVGSRSQTPYGKWLEFGTSTTAERPWLRPALQKNKDKIEQRFVDAIKKGQERAFNVR